MIPKKILPFVAAAVVAISGGIIAVTQIGGSGRSPVAEPTAAGASHAVAGAGAVTIGAKYVDISSLGGRCSNSYTLAQNSASKPWCSLATAFADTAADPGATVYVRGGNYSTVSIPSFAPSANVTFAAYPGGPPPVLMEFDMGSTGGALSQHFTISGFKFGNAGTSGGVVLTNASNYSFTGNTIALTPVPPRTCPNPKIGCTPVAVILHAPMANANLTNNQISNCSAAFDTAGGSNPSNTGVPSRNTFQNLNISSNTITGCGNYSMSLGAFSGLTIANNVFANDRVSSAIDPTCHCDAIHLINQGYGATITGNLIYGGKGILIQPATSTGVATNGTNCRPTCLEMGHVVIANNRLTYSSSTDIGIRVFNAPGIKVLNNTILSPPSVDNGIAFVGASTADPSKGIVMANNIASYFEVTNGNTFATEDYNLVGQRATGSRVGCFSSPTNCTWQTPSGQHDIAGAPSFTNSGTALTLAPSSPGYHKGSQALEAPVDPGYAQIAPVSMGAMGAESPTGHYPAASAPGSTTTPVVTVPTSATTPTPCTTTTPTALVTSRLVSGAL